MTLYVPSAVEMITGMNVPGLITAREHHEEFAFTRVPNPQGKPKIGALSDRYSVSMLTGNRSELHQPDLGCG
jgi:hypothetical protein